MTLFLALAAVVIALVALGLELESRRTPRAGDVPHDLPGLRAEVARLQEQNAGALRHLAVERYDAFSDLGGQLSWSVALVDPAGNGVVLTSIRGREDARTYAKGITAWEGDQELSPEERRALDRAHDEP
ncbi:DUF4446 family protein [Nocardioides panacisoli]|uniref:DUF4446 family protein n=1 Tax=Nocardioides panacisoli TaxID=627624 RepID=UPI001C6300A6|nr:DUF4446 family protein [Nocardioides panacisoli]QYJ03487.1 DUF4446 family protein [Nocardioides panacisoli]